MRSASSRCATAMISSLIISRLQHTVESHFGRDLMPPQIAFKYPKGRRLTAAVRTAAIETASAVARSGSASITARRASRSFFQAMTIRFAARSEILGGTTSTGRPACITTSPGSTPKFQSRRIGSTSAADNQQVRRGRTVRIGDTGCAGAHPKGGVAPRSGRRTEEPFDLREIFFFETALLLDDEQRQEVMCRRAPLASADGRQIRSASH